MMVNYIVYRISKHIKSGKSSHKWNKEWRMYEKNKIKSGV